MAQFEEKKADPRPLAEIQAEYETMCSRLGERHYQIQVYQAEAANLARRCYELNEEAQRAKEKEGTNG